jgi:hypothetical protein
MVKRIDPELAGFPLLDPSSLEDLKGILA